MNRNDFIQRAALQLLLDARVSALPVDALRVARAFGVIVWTYSELSAIISKPVSRIVSDIDPDGFVCYSRSRGSYVIAYNENASANMIRETIMHEVAHVDLGHVTPLRSFYSRNRSRRDFLESEADLFTCFALCPSAVLCAIKASSAVRIQSLCGVTIETALRAARLQSANPSTALEASVFHQFEPFILRYVRNGLRFENAVEVA